MTWSPNIPITEALKLVKMVKNGHFHPLVSYCDWDVWTPSHFHSLLWWGRLLGTLKHSFSILVLSPRCLWHCAICTIFKRFAVLTFSISTTAALWGRSPPPSPPWRGPDSPSHCEIIIQPGWCWCCIWLVSGQIMTVKTCSVCKLGTERGWKKAKMVQILTDY